MPGISIKTTSLCNLMCKNCTVLSWMDSDPDYHLSLRQLKKFIDCSQVYKFDYILLSGGEPLLWDRLYEGVMMLANSGLTDKLTLMTNALAITEETIYKIGTLLNYVDVFRPAKYLGNEKNIDLLLKTYPKAENILVVDRTKHLVPPLEPIPDSLPAICGCQAYALVGDHIDACGPARTMQCKHGLKNELMSIPVQENYLTKLEKYDRFNQIECKYCIANQKVAKVCKEE